MNYVFLKRQNMLDIYLIEQREMISIEINYIDKKNDYNNYIYNYYNCEGIPNEHMPLIKELIDIFYETYIIPEILTDSIIEEQYIDLNKYL